MARRTFFSFHYAPDVWRAWNVRNSWVVQNSRESQGFFDSSVFESKKRESEDALKRFLTAGLSNTSVTCVLVGTETASRRWVRYEIARTVLKGNGLLAVDIHGVKNKDGKTSTKGANPLASMGLYLANGSIYLAEYSGGKWVKYSDYTLAIPARDLWLPAPTSSTVIPLSNHCERYDYCTQDGYNKLAGWIEAAAKTAGK
ncbi:TIR domain-containing protein [Sphingomonas sp. HDW15A]|uniref:TIR domain-containing protein n=1 Tax=Sphingomonas sp. HDW15A TaxID=2714942 RepID=UPI00140D1FE9|nr:TIR domain-containing protein [Sphingomonas sp. HDW15A]QIK95582.1 TIR domain-containing protein [Sphingomonas sp. HDW15A]